MSVGAVSKEYERYLPRVVAAHCEAACRETDFDPTAFDESPAESWSPSVDSFPGVVLFCDISGFTTLMENFVREGRDGLEQLVALLNDYFSRLITLIHRYGGDVVKFAGDALIAVFRAEAADALSGDTGGDGGLGDVGDAVARPNDDHDHDEEEEEAAPVDVADAVGGSDSNGAIAAAVVADHAEAEPPQDRTGLAIAALAATACAWDVMNEMNDHSDESAPLLHMGLGSGDIHVMYVGGVDGRWEFLVCGEPVSQIGPASEHASPDQAVLSGSTWALVDAVADGEFLPGGFVRLIELDLDDDSPEGIALAARLERVASRTDASDKKASSSLMISRSPKARKRFSASVEAPERRTYGSALAAFLPFIIQRNAAIPELAWLGELRTVAVMFLRITNVKPNGEETLSDVHSVVQIVQAVVGQYKGVINKILFDDKGFVVLVGFGLPPSFDQEARRAMLAATRLKERLGSCDVACSVGISTGKVFCGVVGADSRREYTMMADTVNTAARLMTASAADILCDRTTATQFRQARGSFELIQLDDMRLKGMSAPVEVFRPAAASAFDRSVSHLIESSGGSRRGSAADAMEDERTSSERLIVGREAEIAQFKMIVGDFAATGEGAVVILLGEHGMGKSLLMERFEDECDALDVVTYTGFGDSIERKTDYRVWSSVFADIFGIFDAEVMEANRAKVQEVLDGQAELLRYAPLLSSFLPLGWPQNAATKKIKSGARDRIVTKYLADILRLLATRRRMALVVEDLHWFDAASLDLLSQVATIPGVLLVVSSRPFVDAPVPAVYGELRSLPHCTRMRLGPLSRTATASLAAAVLANTTTHLPSAVSKIIFTKSNGNPYFTVEIAEVMRAEGLLVVAADGALKVPNHLSLTDVSSFLPDSIEELVRSRIDSLSLSQAQILKVCAAIGIEVDLRALWDVYPEDDDIDPAVLRTRLLRDLNELIAQKFLVPTASAIDSAAVVAPSISRGRARGDSISGGRRPRSGSFARPGSPGPGGGSGGGAGGGGAGGAVVLKNLRGKLSFANAMTHTVAYTLMLFKHRADLHQRIAEWYEATYADDLTSIIPLLAHHWARSSHKYRAVRFLERAATRAKSRASYLDAKELLLDALAIQRTIVLKETKRRRTSAGSMKRHSLERFGRSGAGTGSASRRFSVGDLGTTPVPTFKLIDEVGGDGGGTGAGGGTNGGGGGGGGGDDDEDTNSVLSESSGVSVFSTTSLPMFMLGGLSPLKEEEEFSFGESTALDGSSVGSSSSTSSSGTGGRSAVFGSFHTHSNRNSGTSSSSSTSSTAGGEGDGGAGSSDSGGANAGGSSEDGTLDNVPKSDDDAAPVVAADGTGEATASGPNGASEAPAVAETPASPPGSSRERSSSEDVTGKRKHKMPDISELRKFAMLGVGAFSQPSTPRTGVALGSNKPKSARTIKEHLAAPKQRGGHRRATPTISSLRAGIPSIPRGSGISKTPSPVRNGRGKGKGKSGANHQVDDGRPTMGEIVLARLEKHLGEVMMGLRDEAEARRHYMAALAALGVPQAETKRVKSTSSLLWRIRELEQQLNINEKEAVQMRGGSKPRLRRRSADFLGGY